jgi:transposase
MAGASGPPCITVEQPQAAARLQAVLVLIDQHKDRWSLPADVRVVVCYEAGQDAFWIWRALQAHGIECYVVDPASILRIPRKENSHSTAK